MSGAQPSRPAFTRSPLLLTLGLSVLLAACQSNPAATLDTLQGTTNVAANLPAGTWEFQGEAAQYGSIQVLNADGGAQVTATQPGNYLLRSGGRSLTYHVAGPVTGQLNLTEVSLNAREGASGWVELYNGTGKAVNLAEYTLRAPARDRSGAAAGTVAFALPDQVLGAGEYLLVTGKIDPNAVNGPQAVFISHGGQLPFWQDRGAVELLRGVQVQDSVQFGRNLSALSGANTVRVANVSSDLISSVMRPRTGTQADAQGLSAWAHTVLPSPGAPNNDASSTQTSAQGLAALAVGDTDNDGIPDSYETSTSGAYNGIYVYNMGARQNQRDIFLEIDWMNSTSNFIRPQRSGIDKMVAAFQRAGYALHVDTGTWFSSTFSPANYNLGGGNQVGYSACIGLGFATSSCDGVLSYKYNGNFNMNRLNLFRYAVLGNSQQPNGSNGSSGVAEIAGNDMVVTMGGWGYSTLTQVANQQGSTIMHEFGHNLNLRHGGFENTNRKPNYYSIMNYSYQLAGLDDTASNVWERAKQWKQSCADLTYNDPCMTSFKMDYSYGQGGRIDEGYVNENAGINRGTAWIDWNNSGAVNTSVRVDVNGDGVVSTGSYYLGDYNDWANVRPTFGYVSPTNANTDINYGSGAPLPRLDVAANDAQPGVLETDHEAETH